MTRLEWNYEWTPHSTRVLYNRAPCGRPPLSANKNKAPCGDLHAALRPDAVIFSFFFFLRSWHQTDRNDWIEESLYRHCQTCVTSVGSSLTKAVLRLAEAVTLELLNFTKRKQNFNETSWLNIVTNNIYYFYTNKFYLIFFFINWTSGFLTLCLDL